MSRREPPEERAADAIPPALSIIDDIAEGYGRGLLRPLPPQRLDLVLRDEQHEQAIARANQLGFATPDLLPSTSPWESRIRQMRLEWGLLNMIGEPALRVIDGALAETGIDPSATWVYTMWGRSERGGQGVFGGRMVIPGHVVGMRGAIPLDFASSYPWDRRFRGYHFELFGLRIRSEDELRQYPPEALWSFTVPGDPSLVGVGTYAIGVYRARVFHPDTLMHGQADWRPGWPRVIYSDQDGGLDDDNKIARTGLKLYRGIKTGSGGRPKTPKDAKVDALAQDGLRWLKANRGAYVQVEDFGRHQMGEATHRGKKAIDDHMNRAPKVVNADVHQRMHELLDAAKSAR